MRQKLIWSQMGLLGLLLMMTVGGCQQRQQEIKNEEILIPVTFLVRADTGENENEALVKQFNNAYEGTYQIKVEWITDTAEGYRSRIKTMNALDKLPAIITDVGFDADFYELLIQNGRLVNLLPYIESEAEWQAAIGSKEIEECKELDGNIYLSTTGDASMSYAGFYYNKKLFRQAGIAEFPREWEDLFQCFQKLQTAGVTPLAIHGGTAYWTSLLIATGYIAETKEGEAFLNTQYPLDYQNKSAAHLFQMVKRLYGYADSDALTIEWNEANKRFLNGENAITANGGWMHEGMTEEVKAQFGFAPFPGNILMKDLRMSGWAVTNGHPAEVIEGAVEFLKFRTVLDQQKEEKYFSVTGDSELDQDYKSAIRSVQKVYPNYQLKWEAAIQEEFLVNILPAYVSEELSLKAFLKQLSQAAVRIELEK